ncbi:hypothetical protein LTR74_010290 [Friedmanniomyces endolithicus]|nr:hypothetical protein LTR74_010290 [Friedmanniomyces endolithicus]
MSVCPVVGTSTTVLPPDHPALSSDPEARCPVTVRDPSQTATRPSPSPMLIAFKNAKVAHHESHIIHSHPSSPTIPDDPHKRMDASMCPAVHSLTRQNTLENEICMCNSWPSKKNAAIRWIVSEWNSFAVMGPVVGAVSAYLPPTHPKLTEQESGKVCPVTNATLAHHEGKLHLHPSVADDAPVSKCPVAGASMNQ